MTGPQEPSDPKNRSATVDIAKGIGIMLVVLGHNWFCVWSVDLHRIIFSFHLPLFFFLSGVFLNPGKRFSRVVADKYRSLLKPYILICALFICAKAVMKREIPADWIVGSLSAIGDSLPPYIGAVWFLPHLFLVSLFSWAFIRLFKIRPSQPIRATIALIVLLVAGYFSIGFFWGMRITLFHKSMVLYGLPLCMDIVIMSGFFFLAGYICRNHVVQFKFNIPLVITAIVLFVLVHLKYRYSLDFNKRQFDHIVWSSLAAVLGIYFTLGISCLLSQRKIPSRWLSYIGRGSIFIMIFHGVCQLSGYFVFQLILPNSPFLAGGVSLSCGIFGPLLVKEGLSLGRSWVIKIYAGR
jgi:fucose 4-O-acetylase-like acetyltransferase